MRKLLIGFLCALILAGLAGCGETATTTTTADGLTTSAETTDEGEPRDGESLIEEIVAKIKDVFD